jgi:Fe2+ or Zn2+ uptake regulation protein
MQRMSPKGKNFSAVCAEAGVPYTPPTHAILLVLSEAERPLTTYDIHRFAKERRHPVALPTAYRLLRSLVAAGVVLSYDLGDGTARYAFPTPNGQGHIVDVVDGSFEAFSDKALREQMSKVAQSLGYELVRFRLVLYGEAGPR